MPVQDQINYPAHYTTGRIEVIDFIEDQNLRLHEGVAIQYICRSPHKGSQISDLKKAIWYLNRRITQLEGISSSERRKS